MVIDFELRGWLMRNLSEGHGAKNHSPARRDLIEINFVPLENHHQSRQDTAIGFLSSASMTWRMPGFRKTGHCRP
jgi:hypothetical protein